MALFSRENTDKTSQFLRELLKRKLRIDTERKAHFSPIKSKHGASELLKECLEDSDEDGVKSAKCSSTPQPNWLNRIDTERKAHFSPIKSKHGASELLKQCLEDSEDKHENIH